MSDIYSPKSWKNDALLQPQSRDAYRRLLAQGWTDAIRELHPGRADVHLLGLLPQPLRSATPACASTICC